MVVGLFGFCFQQQAMAQDLIIVGTGSTMDASQDWLSFLKTQEVPCVVVNPADFGEHKKGDFVVVNTGWHKYFKTKPYVYFNHFPGFYEDAGNWFVDRKVKAVAIDGGAMDSPLAHRPLDKYAPWLYQEYLEETGKDANEEFPIYEPCHLALAKADIPGIEIAGGQIDEVTGIRCTLACFPIRYEQGEASIVRLVAIVDE